MTKKNKNRDMRYLREFKDSEINRWKTISDFGKTKGKSVDELGDEIEKVGGFPEDFVEGGDGQEPLTDDQVRNLYTAIVHDVENAEQEEEEEDSQIDDSLEESRILCFESFGEELYWLEGIDEAQKSGVAKSLKKKSQHRLPLPRPRWLLGQPSLSPKSRALRLSRWVSRPLRLLWLAN